MQLKIVNDLLKILWMAKFFSIATICCMTVAHNARAASFDCNRAKSKSEILICQDPELSALDDSLAILYKKAKRTAQNYQSFSKENREQWKEREATCGDKDCLKAWYAKREGQLNKWINTLATAILEDPQHDDYLKGDEWFLMNGRGCIRGTPFSLRQFYLDARVSLTEKWNGKDILLLSNESRGYIFAFVRGRDRCELALKLTYGR